jgi:tyrosine-protein kinase Etk/Wzc
MREDVLAEFVGTWGPSVGSMLVSVEPNTKEKGVIALTVEARDPKLAAEIANYYFESMRARQQRNAERAAKTRELFYVSQLERASKEVAAAEEALLKFQSENRMLATLDPSTKANVEGAVSLRSAIMALEMQREVMRMRFTEQHPQIREIEKQVSELKKQYSQNLFGAAMDLPPEGPSVKGTRKEFFVAAAKMTPVQFAFLKLFRNLKIQEAFYTGAFQGLEQIRYGDGMSPLNVDVLDPAVIPTTHSRPNIPLTVAAAAVSALVAGIMLAFVLEYLARVRVELRQGPARIGRAGDGLESHEVPGREAARIGPASSRGVSPYAGGSSSARATTGPGPAR